MRPFFNHAAAGNGSAYGVLSQNQHLLPSFLVLLYTAANNKHLPYTVIQVRYGSTSGLKGDCITYKKGERDLSAGPATHVPQHVCDISLAECG